MTNTNNSALFTSNAIGLPWAMAVRTDSHEDWDTVCIRLMGMISLCIWHELDMVLDNLETIHRIAQSHRSAAIMPTSLAA